MNAAIDENLEIPARLIPCCPKCGAEMETWVRGYTFLEGKKYRDEYRKINEFIARHQADKILFLELGVGRMTPMFIQEPFWNLTYQLPNAYYISINPKDALLPEEIADKGTAMKEDIAVVLRNAVLLQKEQCVQAINTAIRKADAILIGASNGLSISDGYHIFADNEWFRENFGDFRSKYGIHNLLQGMFLKFSCPEEQWAFFSRLAYRVHYGLTPSQMMQKLYGLVKEKDYFVVTSNGEDHFTPAGFLPEQVFEVEGKLTEYRCADHCHDEVYNNREDVIRMAAAEKDGMVPTELLPKCPKCGGLMEPNLPGGQEFFRTESWKKKAKAYEDFTKKYHGKRLVILEFGIGFRNQMIKEPLMQLAAAEPNCTYITFNKGELYIPAELMDKSIGVDGDIAEAISKIVAIKCA